MEVITIGPGFGAEVRGCGLADVAADDRAYAAVRAAFEEHSVLLFRGQPITDELQVAFSQRFGPPAQRIRGNEHLEHWLYPALGLSLALDSQGKEVLQYVAPAQFGQLRDPLVARAASAAR